MCALALIRGLLLPHEGSEGINKELPERSLGWFLPTCAHFIPETIEFFASSTFVCVMRFC